MSSALILTPDTDYTTASNLVLLTVNNVVEIFHLILNTGHFNVEI